MRKVIFCICLHLSMGTFSQTLNGFNLKESLIPLKEILRGGPPRDGIPSIDKPVFTSAGESNFGDRVQVLGVYYHGIAKAYPVAIMNWHEIVNDHFGEVPISITYCPLCGSGMAYLGKLDGMSTSFGVSGLLYNSDVLLYDRKTNSLWSQILNKAVTGEMKGTELIRITTQRTSLGAWKKIYPETLVLTTKTGFVRDYNRSPYRGYDTSSSIYFPVANKKDLLHEKEWVLGVELNGKFKAYPISKLAQLDVRKLKDKIGRDEITLSWDEGAENIIIKTSAGDEVVGIQLFWFAWYAFHPDSAIWSLY